MHIWKHILNDLPTGQHSHPEWASYSGAGGGREAPGIHCLHMRVISRDLNIMCSRLWYTYVRVYCYVCVLPVSYCNGGCCCFPHSPQHLGTRLILNGPTTFNFFPIHPWQLTPSSVLIHLSKHTTDIDTHVPVVIAYTTCYLNNTDTALLVKTREVVPANDF